jgi:hypothetical protein
MQQNNNATSEKDQDNIGYENTLRRNDSDERELDRLETTDTDNDEDDPVDVSFDEDIKDADDDDDNEEKVFGQL